MTTSMQRYRGCLLGLATGDALGTTLEFHAPGSFAQLTDMVGGGPFHLQPGEWTDDTSMALCLAESLIERQGFDPLDQLERYDRWFRTGHLSSNGRCFDIGNTTRQALLLFEQTHQPFCGSTEKYSAGNGSLMRLAPVALYYAKKPQEAIHFCGESSRTTHGAAEAIDACCYYGALLVGALTGKSKVEILARQYTPLPGYWEAHPLSPAVEEVASGTFKQRQPPDIQGSGYVVRSLEAALWAFYHSSSFQDGCLKAANLGDDADTTAAIYGQLGGAFYGASSIPAGWRGKLRQGELIAAYADKLQSLAEEL
jgi:ADP-ribosyl-[dinitrogen reductase] hydrolase